MAEVYEVVQIFPDGYEQHISISDTLEEAKRDIQEFPVKYRHNGRLEIKKRAENFGGEPEPDFQGHNVCVECGSDEIPLSSTDGGTQGLIDYYFNCSECNFGWFVAVRDETNEDEPNTVNATYEGFMDFYTENWGATLKAS